MPPTLDGLPDEVQVAFFIYGLMPDVWDGASGTYMGKNWSPLRDLYKIYEVEEPKIITYFIREIENLYSKNINEDLEKKRKAEERKAKQQSGGGKKFAHKVSA